MVRKKREITIRFVTTVARTKISSFVDAISDEADEISITCKNLDRPLSRQAAQPVIKKGRAVGAAGNGVDHRERSAEEEVESHRPQLVYQADVSAIHRRHIDVEASLDKLKLTRDDLMSRRWTKGSAQDRLKRAVAAASRMN